jgi:TonB-dependent starch-binding outer membrane protein SusC
MVDVQQLTVTGRVTDASTFDPLPGVTIVVRGTPSGTTTNVNGEYTLSVPTNAILEFSFVGFQRQAVIVDGRQRIDVALEQELTALEEVVAIGYGTRERGRLTGSVASVTGDVVEEYQTDNTTRALQGIIPGLRISDRGGSPGTSELDILVRGKATLGNNSPLIVIDGVPRTTANFNHISPQDIESISVLKDAAAAIYGAQAATVLSLYRLKGVRLARQRLHLIRMLDTVISHESQI